MIYRTLGDLRSELSRRLGFGAQGSSGINSGLLDSFLQNAQTQLFNDFEWRSLIKSDEETLGVGQQFYDYSNDCDPSRIIDVAVWDGVRWVPMREGITWAMRSDTTQFQPRFYERFLQMEIWPLPDTQYAIRRYYVASPSRFTEDNDRASIDDGLIFLHALTNAKLHYKQTDGQVYANQLNSMLTKLKGRNRGKSIHVRDDVDTVYMARPKDV